MDDESDCGKCKKKVKDDDCIGCEGLCHKWFHRSCVSITVAELKIIKKNKQLKWMCEVCNDQYIHLVETSMKKLMNEMMETMKKSMETMIAGKINEILKLNNVNQELQQQQTKISYADKVKGKKEEVIIVQPKKTQSSETTKKICKEKLDPSQLKVGIENIRKIRNGGIAITCKSKDEIQKIDTEAKKQLGNEYIVKNPVLKKPKLRIFDVEEEMGNAELLMAIQNQNPEVVSKDTEIEVVVIKKLKNSYMIVIEVDPLTFKKIMVERRLKIKWQCCYVSEHLGISRCMKCYAYDHKNEECKKGKICMKCGGDHLVKDCKATEAKCANCIESNEKLKLGLDVNHSVLSQACPVYKRRITMKQRAVMYDKI